MVPKAQALLKEFQSVEELVANTERLSGKTKQMIEDQKETLLLSKRLATLHMDLAFPLTLRSLRFLRKL